MNTIKNKRIPKYETKTFTGEVVLDENGKRKVRWDHENYYQYELKKFNLGDKILARYTNKKQKRTEAQNRYMHLYFSLIGMASGHSTREIKAWAKGKLLSKGITEVFGDKTRLVKETSELTLLEMIEFIDRVEAETGVPAPDTAPFLPPMSQEEWDSLKEAQRIKYQSLKPKLT